MREGSGRMEGYRGRLEILMGHEQTVSQAY